MHEQHRKSVGVVFTLVTQITGNAGSSKADEIQDDDIEKTNKNNHRHTEGHPAAKANPTP